MNPLFRIIYKQFKTRKNNTTSGNPSPTDYRESLAFEISLRRQFSNAMLIILGIISAGFALKGFLLPAGFIDGGVTGISLLLTEVTGFPLSALLIIINIPFIYLGYKNVGKNFALKTLFAIIGLATVVSVIHFPIVTSDKILVAIFGGSFLGAGIGLCMRGGGVIDGTEIVALSLSRKLSITVGDVILIVNLFIFLVAAFLLSSEQALYSILTYLSAAKTVDFLISSIEEYTGVTIISEKNEAIRKMITAALGRGVTIYNGKGGYGKHGHQPEETAIVFTVVTRLEISGLKAEIEKIDRDAFVIMHSIKDTKGGMIKKRPLAH